MAKPAFHSSTIIHNLEHIEVEVISVEANENVLLRFGGYPSVVTFADSPAVLRNLLRDAIAVLDKATAPPRNSVPAFEVVGEYLYDDDDLDIN